MTAAVREIKTRSLSQYNLYTRCSEQYRLERVERVPTPPAGWLAQGTAFHHAIEFWERSGRTIDAAALYLAEYDRLVVEGREREPDLGKWQRAPRQLTINDLARRRELGVEQVHTYTRAAVTAPWRIWELPDGEPALEVGFRLDLGTVVVTGYIDAVLEFDNGAIIPRDYKTGSKVPSSYLQLGIYALALREMFGVPVGYGDWWLAKHGGAVDPVPLHRYTKEYITTILTDLDRAIQAGIFLPNAGDHCRMCAVRQYCREVGDSTLPVRDTPIS